MSSARLAWRAGRIRSVGDLRVGDGAAILPRNVNGLHLEFASLRIYGNTGPRVFWRDYLKRLKFHNPEVPMIVNRTHHPAGPSTLSIYVEGEAKAKPRRTQPLPLPSPDLSAVSAKAGSSLVPSTAKSATASVARTDGTASLGSETSVGRRAFDMDDPWIGIHSHSHGGCPAPEARPGETRIQIDVKWKDAKDIWQEFLDQSGANVVEKTEEDLRFLEDKQAFQEKRRARYEKRIAIKAIEAEKKARLEAALAEAAALKDV